MLFRSSVAIPVAMGMLALAVGIFILIGRFVPAPAITSNRRRWFIISGASPAGVVLLAIYLIPIGMINLFSVAFPIGAIGILALAAGIFILIGMKFTKNIGMLLLAIYLIVDGLLVLGLNIGGFVLLLYLVAIAAGIFILIGK